MNIETAVRLLRNSPEKIDKGTASEIADLVESVVERLEIAKRYIEADAYCPCCIGISECEPECTILEDHPDIAETIEAAREVLSQLD